jgi:hypothetical protein
MHQEVREFALGRYSEDRPEMAEPPQQAFMENQVSRTNLSCYFNNLTSSQLSPIRESFPDFDDYGHSRVRVETYDPRPVPERFGYRERLPPLEISGDAHQDPYNECRWGHPRRSPAPLPEGARPFSYPLAIVTDEGYFGSCSESICSTDSYGLEFDDLDSDVDEPDPVDPVVPEGKVVDLITGEIRDRMKMEDFEDIMMKKYEERWDRLHEEGKTDKIKEYEEGDEEYDFKEWLVVKEERKRA